MRSHTLRQGGRALALAALAILMGTGVWGQRMDRGTAARVLRRPHVSAEFIVQFREPEAAPDTDDVARYVEGGVAGLQRLGAGRFHLVRTVRAGQDVLAGLSEHPEIVSIEPNYSIQVEKTPGDPLFGQQWGLKNSNNADIAATAAWDYTTGGKKTVVAVIDTGVDYTHPDLAANIWSAPRPFTFNGAAGTVTCAAGSKGVNAIDSTCTPMDDNGHGTHCAGIIGAAGNNGAGVVGVNWEAAILPIKFLDKNGSGSLADALRAIDSVVQIKKQFGAEANVRVINASWGFGGTSVSLDAAIGAANTADILFVAAAGNDGKNNDSSASYPANSPQPNVVSVAATDSNDGLASFSNYGQKVHLGAPGVGIASTYPANRYANMSGTSMATPFVAGTAALVLSTCTANTAGLRENLLATVDAVPALSGKTQTGGRLNAYKAIRQCASPAATLTATPQAVTVVAGGTASYSLLPGGLTGTGTLAVTEAPAGVTVTGAGGVTFGTAVTVKAVTATTTAAGTYTLTATLTAGSVTVSTPLSLKVEPAATATLTATPASVTVRAGETAAYSLLPGGSTGAATLAVTGAPAGVTVTGAGGVTFGTAVTVKAVTATTTAAGTYTLTATLTAGSVTVSTPLSLKVEPAATATLTATPASVTVRAGETASYSLLPAGTGGSTGTLAITGAPAGVTVTGAGTVTLGTAVTVRAATATTVAAGTYTLTATLTVGNIKVSAPLSLKVQSGPQFTFKANAPAAAVTPGSSAPLNLVIVRQTGFTGPVVVTPQGLPAGVTASTVTLASGQTTATMALNIGSAAAAGAATMQLAAAGGGTTVTLPATVTVSRALKLGFGAPQYAVKAGGTATLAVILSSNAPVSSALKFMLAGLPGPAAVSLATGPAGTLQLKILTPAGWAGKTAALKLTAMDGALKAEATAKLTVTN